MMRSRGRHGMTRVEVCIGVICVAAVLAMGATAMQDDDDTIPCHPSTIKDAKQAQLIHKAMLIYSAEDEGVLPAPGRVNRLAVVHENEALNGQQIPGMGEEDFSVNTTANVFSVLIAQNYMTPELPISILERNPNVSEDKDYNYDAYNPAEDVYWDSSFTADLAKGSNVSYAHQPITKERRNYWTNSLDPKLAQIGNRGPRNGMPDTDSFTCGPHGNWTGNITFADNHTELLFTPTPKRLEGDNLFKADKREIDSLLAFTKLIKDGKAELQFD